MSGKHQAYRQLVKEGQWTVPVAERPRGWETWPVRIEVGVAGVPDILRCACGRAARHAGRCIYRRLQENSRLSRYIEQFREEMVPAIRESAQGMGCEPELEMAARILFAGIYNHRSVPKIRKFTGASLVEAERVIANCLQQKLWLPDGSVVLGELDQPYGDLEFWLCSMSAYREILFLGDGKFQAKTEGERA